MIASLGGIRISAEIFIVNLKMGRTSLTVQHELKSDVLHPLKIPNNGNGCLLDRSKPLVWSRRIVMYN